MIKPEYKKFFHTLANKTRLEIIFVLRSKEMNVTEIIEATGFKQSAVSHNLKRLVHCEFVYVRKDGQYRYYSLNKDTMEPLLRTMDTHVNKYCKRLCKKCDR